MESDPGAIFYRCAGALVAGLMVNFVMQFIPALAVNQSVNALALWLAAGSPMDDFASSETGK